MKNTSSSLTTPLSAPKASFNQVIAKYGTIFALIFVFLIFSVTSERFIQVDNLLNIMRQIANLSIVALGMTAAMAAGEFDLAAGNVASLSGIVVTTLLVNDFSIPVAILAAVMVGVLIGAVNGVIATKVNIPSIIVTLGVSSILVGIVFMITEGRAVYGGIPEAFNDIARGFIGPLSNLIIIMVLFVAITYLMLNKTITGRYIYAVGGNSKAANLSGINTTKYRIMALMISSVFAAIAGILLASRLGSGQPTGGTAFTMDGIGAVFIGMTTIKMGRPNVIGTLIGVALIGIMSNGLNMIGLPYYIQDMAKGAIMIGAVAFAASRTELKFFG